MRQRKESSQERVINVHALHCGELKLGITESSEEARGPRPVTRSCTFQDQLKSTFGRNDAHPSGLQSAHNMHW